jgi:hypothetical protein
MFLQGTGAGAGMDSAWEQKKLEATLREMLAVGVASKQTMIYQDTPRFVRRSSVVRHRMIMA